MWFSVMVTEIFETSYFWGIAFLKLYKIGVMVSQGAVIYTMRQRILLLRPMRQRERKKMQYQNDSLGKLISTFDGD